MIALICPCRGKHQAKRANTFGINFRLFLRLLALFNTGTPYTFASIIPFVLVSPLTTAPLLYSLHTHTTCNLLSFPHRLIEQSETSSISTHHLDQHTHIQHYRPITPKQSEQKWHLCTHNASYQPSRSPGSLALPDFARLQTSSGTVLSQSPYPCGRCNVPTPLQLPPRRTPAGGSDSGRSIYPARPPNFYGCA